MSYPFTRSQRTPRSPTRKDSHTTPNINLEQTAQTPETTREEGNIIENHQRSQKLQYTSELERNKAITDEDYSIQPPSEPNTEDKVISDEDQSVQQINNIQPASEISTVSITTNTHYPQHNKMVLTEEQIHQKVVNLVSEFDGENCKNKEAELSKFFSTADRVYKCLNVEEKLIFDQLILFKLGSDTYSKIYRRNIGDYPSLKKALSSIYTTTHSLQELEAQCFNIRQQYQEPIREYGTRIEYALAEYISGYKDKYGIHKIDTVFEQHLNEAAVQTFKRGINNTILKEKIITIKARKIEDIINETEEIDKMIIEANNGEQRNLNRHVHFKPTTQEKIEYCTYCKRKYHNWNNCRTRMREQTKPVMQTYQRYTPNFNKQQNVPRFSYLPPPPIPYPIHPIQTGLNNHRNATEISHNIYPIPQLYTNTIPHNYQQPYTHQPINPIIPPQNNPSPHKTNRQCNYCKQYGHNIFECQKKKRYDSKYKFSYPQDTTNLTEQFDKLNISMIQTKSDDQINRPEN